MTVEFSRRVPEFSQRELRPSDVTTGVVREDTSSCPPESTSSHAENSLSHADQTSA